VIKCFSITGTRLLLWTLFIVLSFWSTLFRKLDQWSNVVFFFYRVELNSKFYLSVKFTAWQKISILPLSKTIVLIKPRRSEEQQPNRRNFHDQDVAVNVVSSKADGDCCKPPIQSCKAPPCFTSSTEFSGAKLSVCGQILRPVFVIPSYSDFKILVEPHRILAVCVENRYSLPTLQERPFVVTRFSHVVLYLCGPDACMAWHTAVELYRCSAAEAMQCSFHKKWLCRLASCLEFLCLWSSAVVYWDSKKLSRTV
jgi:hypothetical protein